MARSFQLTPGTPAATTYIIEASADNLGPWATTDTIDAAALVDLLDGTYRLDAPLSPPDQYVRIIPTDGTLFGTPLRTYPPQPTDPGVFEVYVYASTVGLAAVPGWVFAAAAVKGSSVGDKTVVLPSPTQTNAEGYAILQIMADVGVITVSLGGISRVVDSTGRAGQIMAFADLSAA
jgi:hypothetical protein